MEQRPGSCAVAGFARLTGPKALAALLALVFALFAAPTRAQEPLRIDATPLLGAESAAANGWLSIGVRIDNGSSGPINGAIEVTSDVPWGDKRPFVTTAPFAVGGKSRIILRVPTHGLVNLRAAFHVRALDSDGHELAGLTLPDARGGGPVLFDFSIPSRLAAALEGRSVPARTSPYSSTPTNVPLAVTNPLPSSASGEPVLPDRGMGYGPAAAVIASSADLVALGPEESLALGDWVLGGGALAVVISRPEDLSAPVFHALIGGTATQKPAPRELADTAAFTVSEGTTTPYGHAVRRASRPSNATSATFVGYAGGNLHDSRWGASASYGLGEVQLLAFDPLRSPEIRDDEWTKLSVLELVRHALDRREVLAFPSGVRPMDDGRIDELRRLLDPNEGSRWTVIVATILLLAYAVMAGPVSFARAQRRGKPERALFLLPLWSAGALFGVVALGVIGKGVEGRSRRIALIESGAGMPAAGITRFRGLYSARSERLTVWTSDRDALLDVAGDDTDTDRHLVVDRQGARLERLQAKPWEIVVVREDATVTLGGGISIAKAADGRWTIANRCARDLIGVVARADAGDLFYFSRIKDGQSVALGSGRRLGFTGPTPSHFGKTQLDVGVFADALDADVHGASAAWRAIEALADGTDWWPSETPALVAQFDGGEGVVEDSGLRIDSDRTLVRVIGRGGLP